MLSALAMALVCVAFYAFLDRQLDLRQVIAHREVLAIAVAASGAVLLVALPLNDLVIARLGLTAALGTVGLVEEGTKLLVPVVFYLLNRFRDPRAGIAAGLAAGFGFAVTETTTYAFTLPLGGAPDPCTGAELPAPGAFGSLVGQVYRIALVSPLHWFWTGIAVAVLWRQWRLHGLRVNGPVVGALLLVVGTHSLNDSQHRLDLRRPARRAGARRRGRLRHPARAVPGVQVLRPPVDAAPARGRRQPRMASEPPRDGRGIRAPRCSRRRRRGRRPGA